MIDEQIALLRAHGNNIARYRRLLHTKLSEVERLYIHRRLAEEQEAMTSIGPTSLFSKHCDEQTERLATR